jgi:hypothetical protein
MNYFYLVSIYHSRGKQESVINTITAMSLHTYYISFDLQNRKKEHDLSLSLSPSLFLYRYVYVILNVHMYGSTGDFKERIVDVHRVTMRTQRFLFLCRHLDHMVFIE